MNREQWQRLLGKWCEILRIQRAPRLVIVAAADIPGCDAIAEFDDTRAEHWTIKVRRGKHRDPELIMCHELLHVRTGLTDAAHEAWICDISAALVAGHR